jgi:excisionase family DNA binding protein
MNPLLEKNLISTKEASSLSGYNADYLARLCRSGKIVGTRLGRAWLVSQESLEAFVKQQEVKKQELSSTLSQIRGTEYHNYVPNNAINKSDVTFDNGTSNGLEKTSDLTTYTTFQKRAFAVLASFVVMLIGVYGAQAQVIGQVGNDALATALSVSYGFDTILSNGIQSAESSASNTIAVAQSQPASTIFPKISNQEAAVSGAKNIVDTLAPLALTQHTDAAEVSPNTPVLPNASVASTSLQRLKCHSQQV